MYYRIMRDIKDDIVIKLSKLFFKGSTRFNINAEEIIELNWQKQEDFLHSTIQSEIFKLYPLNSEFCNLFFKKLIGFLESTQEVHDDIYTFLCSNMKNKTGSNGFCYRHYLIDDDLNKVIVIKETKNMVVNGTTGMRTWDAAYMLSDWIIAHKEVFHNKKILELGSGVGFIGVTMGKMCSIESILMTDHHTDVLNTIKENLKINFTEFQQLQQSTATIFTDTKKTIGVMMLDWNSIEDVPTNLVPDVIIGADIVYDPSILQPLCNVIQTFIVRNRALQVYIASVIRNEDTFNKFLETLDLYNLKYDKIDMARSIHIDWNESISKCLLKISSYE